ncbi:MAG: carbohydrate kinase family protein, partial [Victivallaceae bacterium]
ASDLAQFAGRPITEILNEITRGAAPKAFNLGGPAIVAAVNAAQLLYGKPAEFDYYGAFGNDETAEKLLALLRRLPVNLDNLQRKAGISPFTYVLSDAKYHNNKGERAFVNNIGTAEAYQVTDLPDNFFDCDIAFYSATALVPEIHDNLRQLLQRSKAKGALNVVATVFDFRNEKLNPNAPWPLGDSAASYPLIDLLLMDYDEAARLSGKSEFDAVCDFFVHSGVGAFVITHGAHEFFVWSGGKLFKP